MSTMRVWQSVLYCRTRRADQWWRVFPRQDDENWLSSVVLAIVAGGEDLETGPRFVLARKASSVLMGTAARAGMISDTMNSDGSRPLYCFIGWTTSNSHARIPNLEVFEAGWQRWARDVFEGWMPLDWERHPAELDSPHEPPLERAPWAAKTEQPGARCYGERNPRADGSMTPYEDRAEIWSQLVQSSDDFTLAVCPSPLRIQESQLFTHVVSAEAPAERREVTETPGPGDQAQKARRMHTPNQPAQRRDELGEDRGVGLRRSMRRGLDYLARGQQASTRGVSGADVQPPTGTGADLGYWQEEANLKDDEESDASRKAWPLGESGNQVD